MKRWVDASSQFSLSSFSLSLSLSCFASTHNYSVVSLITWFFVVFADEVDGTAIIPFSHLSPNRRAKESFSFRNAISSVRTMHIQRMYDYYLFSVDHLIRFSDAFAFLFAVFFLRKWRKCFHLMKTFSIRLRITQCGEHNLHLWQTTVSSDELNNVSNDNGWLEGNPATNKKRVKMKNRRKTGTENWRKKKLSHSWLYFFFFFHSRHRLMTTVTVGDDRKKKKIESRNQKTRPVHTNYIHLSLCSCSPSPIVPYFVFVTENLLPKCNKFHRSDDFSFRVPFASRRIIILFDWNLIMQIFLLIFTVFTRKLFQCLIESTQILSVSLSICADVVRVWSIRRFVS